MQQRSLASCCETARDPRPGISFAGTTSRSVTALPRTSWRGERAWCEPRAQATGASSSIVVRCSSSMLSTPPNGLKRHPSAQPGDSIPAEPKPPNHGRAWHPGDEHRFAALWMAGTSVTDMAEELGRTEGGMIAKAVDLDLVRDRDAGEPSRVRPQASAQPPP